jgi:hypothetical protein
MEYTHQPAKVTDVKDHPVLSTVRSATPMPRFSNLQRALGRSNEKI